MMKKMIVSVLLCLGYLQNVHAVSGWQCTLAGIVELRIPGAGYLALGEWDEALIFGGLRWNTGLKAAEFINHENYQEDASEIYKKENDEDGNERITDVFLTRETFYARHYGTLYQNLTFITIYDLYAGECEGKADTYSQLFSPFRIDLWGGEWTFWIPTLLVGAANSEIDITYHTQDLTKNEMLQADFMMFQLVGIGEEMLFRGVIQRSLYNWYSTWLDRKTARWSGIVTGAGIFGLAHTGQGFSANAGAAFLAGLYLGWVYHPEDDEFDLEQAIAIHSWWDSILAYQLVNQGKHKEWTRTAYLPILSYRTQF